MGDWQYINLLHEAILGRGLNPQEAERYVEAMRREPDLRLIADDLLDSDEFRQLKSKPDRKLLPTVDRRWQAEEFPPVKEILLVKGDHLGDLLIALPAIQMLRQAFPAAEFTLLCSPWNAKLAESFEVFSRIICAPLDIVGSRDQEFPQEDREKCIEVVRSLPQYDVAIILKPEEINNFLVGHIRGRLIAGFDLDPKNGIAGGEILSVGARETLEAQEGSYIHTKELLCLLAGRVIARIYSIGCEHQWGPVRKIVIDDKKRLSGSPRVALNTGAGAATRCWPVSYYAQVCNEIATSYPEATFYILGTQDQSLDAQRLIELGRPDLRIVNLVGKTSLLELIKMIKEFDVYVGNDTGTTHLASLFCPTICVSSGVTLAERFGPVGHMFTSVRADVPCYGCGINELRNCSNGHQCMVSISPETVTAEIEIILRGLRSQTFA